MRHHPPRAGLLVDLLAGLEHLLLRDEPVLGHLRGRIRQQRHLGVAVHVDLFDVVRVFEIVDRLFLVADLLVPAGLADRLARLDEARQARVVAQEMGVAVDDKLRRQPLRALGRHIRRRRLGLADLEEAAKDLVHDQERGGHAGCGLKEPPARQALPPGEPVAQFLEPRFDLALLLGLRHRHVFVARHDLRRHRRREG